MHVCMWKRFWETESFEIVVGGDIPTVYSMNLDTAMNNKCNGFYYEGIVRYGWRVEWKRMGILYFGRNIVSKEQKELIVV